MFRLFCIITVAMSIYSHSSNAGNIKKIDENKSNTLNFSGYLMVDHDYFSAFYNEDESEYQHKTEIRRSKIGVTFTPNQYIKGKIQVKYSQVFANEGQLIPGDIYFRVKTNSNFGFQIGHMKEPFGLEQQTSSSELIAIERSLPTTVFSPKRSYGLLIDIKKRSYTLAGGYFQNKDRGSEFLLTNFDIFQRAPKDIKALTMRLTAAPIHKNNSTLHIGSSVSKRWLFENKVQLKSKGEVHTADSIIRGSRFFADESNLYQIDLAIHRGSFLAQGEFFVNKIQQFDGRPWSFYGGYAQASYNAFGHYKYKKGNFKSSSNNDNFSLEWVIRHSYINLEDNNIGSKASSSLLGMNLHINSYLKLMMNTSTPWITGDTINGFQTGRSYSLRAQISF